MPSVTIPAHAASGELQSAGTSWAIARAGTGTFTAAAGPARIGAGFSSPNNYAWAAFLAFDLSAVPALATITGAHLETVFTADVTATDMQLRARVRSWLPAIAGADWIAGASIGAVPIVATRETLGLTLGGYLALAGHRSHLYQSNNRLVAHLAELIRSQQQPQKPEKPS